MSITVKKAKLKGRILTLDYLQSVESGSGAVAVELRKGEFKNF